MDTVKNILLTSAYLGPIQYFSRFASDCRITIEKYDHYTKQTYRNRCVILGANGPLNLVIPIVKNHGRKTLMQDIRIDYATNWKRLHLTGITSAYNSSAFFEFYFDAFEPLYKRKMNFLLDLNMGLTRVILDALGLHPQLSLTESYISDARDFQDDRYGIHPKLSQNSDPAFTPVRYPQVFSGRFDFVPNLSIIDLLFNTGPEAKKILEAGLVFNRT